MANVNIQFDNTSSEPKYKQIVNAIVGGIKRGDLKVGDQLMSLNEASAQFNIAKDTVQRAYRKLREKGIIEPVPSKGFFIKASYVDAQMRVLLIFNKMTAYKKSIFNAFANALSTKAVVDLQVHYYDEVIFEKIIDSSVGQYNYYVVMPFFFEYNDRLKSIFAKIPQEKLLLLNKKPAFLSECKAVYEDFENDIYQVLNAHTSDIAKFDQLILVFPDDPMSNDEIKTGFIKFCKEQKLNYTIETGTKNLILKARNLYIIIDDDDLAEVIKKCRFKMMEIGKDIGLISYNDTVLKEVLENGISVISTDFEQMGESAAEMILTGKSESIKNPFRMIRRNSF